MFFDYVGIWETFSKRQKRRERAGKQDVYQYDDLPAPLRMQVCHIWNTAIGVYHRPRGYYGPDPSPANGLWEFMHDTLARELGLGALTERGGDSPRERCLTFVLNADALEALDLIELSCRAIDRGSRELDYLARQRARITQDPDDALEELNHRFLEHRIGYQYSGGFLIRLDSQFLHVEAIKPALALLNTAGFDGPADEFIKAFEHYRHGRNKEAVDEALKAFESTMKSICDARKWTYPATASAKQLMEVVFDRGLVPAMLESHFTNLRAAMESGLPTIRNKTSGHGQGPVPVELPPHFAAYSLHLTASNIVFLVEAHKNLK